MGSGADTTRANWEALLGLTADIFSELHRAHPEWATADLCEHLGLPRTNLFKRLARESGFAPARGLLPKEEAAVLRAMVQGVVCPEAISRQTGVPANRVREFVERVGVPFGAGGFGSTPWPGGPVQALAKAEAAVAERRVSRKGQFSYRGTAYTLGAAYGGSICWVRDAGSVLVVLCPGRPHLTLRKRR